MNQPPVLLTPISGGAVMAWVPLIVQLAPLLMELASQAPKVVGSVGRIFTAIREDERTPDEYKVILAADDLALGEKARRIVELASTVRPLPLDYDPNKPRSYENVSATPDAVNPD